AARPVENAAPAPQPPSTLPLECSVLQPPPAQALPPAAAAGEVRPGRYLVGAGNCVACHTATGGAPFAGGRAIETPFGTVFSTNITPDAATGIGAWSREDFWNALHHGRAKDGRLLYPAFPYPNFTQLSRKDVDAMYDYLRTLPA